MITIRRAKDRLHELSRNRELWHTFHRGSLPDPLGDGFGSLQALDESRLSPGAGIPPRAEDDADVVTYVREGALALADGSGRSDLIRAGEFQCMTSGHGGRHTHTNTSAAEWAHVFQLTLRPSKGGLDQSHEQKRFSTAERRGLWCVVASPDGRRGSLRVHQDTVVYSAILDRGQHLVHELTHGRSVWLHLVQGEAMVSGVSLTTGDGAGVATEPAVSLTARESTEALLLDLSGPTSAAARRRGR